MTEIYRGDPNIFAEIGLPEPEVHLLKARLIAEIYRLAQQLGLTQAKAGEVMGITQPEVSRLFKGNFRDYSVERLMGFLTAFDRDVEIVLKTSEAGKGQITIRNEAA